MAYAGLIEVVLTFIGVTLFVLWQIRSLNRDVAAREARERQVTKINIGQD
jgi:hypothetical protein